MANTALFLRQIQWIIYLKKSCMHIHLLVYASVSQWLKHITYFHQSYSAVKNRVIGNKRQKMNLINQGIVNKLINILNDKHQPEEVKIEAVIVLGSLAKGHDNQVEAIIASGAIETLVTSECF